jgi:valyl-tRNA synthetase
MKVGRRLAIKVLNAAKFVLSFEAPNGATEVTEPVDQAMLRALSEVVKSATDAFENYDHTKALELTESFFWGFTDNYLELVKDRAYGQGGVTEAAQASAVVALRRALHVMLRLFAPFLPYATDEVWSWWQNTPTIHREAWPTTAELSDIPATHDGLLDLAATALFGVRKAKSDAKVSMKAEVASATLRTPKVDATKLIEGDIKAVGRIAELTITAGDEVERHVGHPHFAEPADGLHHQELHEAVGGLRRAQHHRQRLRGAAVAGHEVHDPGDGAVRAGGHDNP